MQNAKQTDTTTEDPDRLAAEISAAYWRSILDLMVTKTNLQQCRRLAEAWRRMSAPKEVG